MVLYNNKCEVAFKSISDYAVSHAALAACQGALAACQEGALYVW